MKVVVCQGASVDESPPREVLIEYWKEQLKDCEEIKEVVFRPRFDFENVDAVIEDADALVGAWIKDDYFDDVFFTKYPNLKYVASFAHGYGRIDKSVVRKHNVTFTNTVYGDTTIAQFAMALLLDICHGIRLQDRLYKNALDNGISMGFGKGFKVACKQIELYGKTIGILGLGNIGFQTAKMAAGFGMKVIAYNRSVKEGPKYDFIEQVSLDDLYERSDVISIHCPLNNETKGMINKSAIKKMKDSVIIINTARGGIIDEPDLVEALKSGKVYAAGLDVVSGEPLKERCPLMDCPNAIITPHIAWVPEEARYRSVKVAAENLKNWVKNEPTSVIA